MSSSVPDSWRILVVVCVAFLAMGMAQASIGPALPDLARRTQSSVVAAGGALACHYGGALAGYFAAGLLFQRIGRRWVMITGMIFFITGASGVAASSVLALLLTAAACTGFGSGIAILAGNVLAAEASRGAGPLNLVNAMFGVGAITSPSLVGASMFAIGTGIPALWATPCMMTLGITLLFTWAFSTPEPSSQQEHAAVKKPHRLRFVLASPLVWTICGFLLLYISVEAGISGWLPTILQRSTELPLAAGAIVVSLFWFLITAIRFGAAWASRFVGPKLILRACIGLCIVGGMLLVVCSITGSWVLGFASSTLLGLGLGPILPTTLSVMRSSFPRDPGITTGLVMGVGSIGGVVVPWALGALIINVGVAEGTGILLLLSLVMAILLVAIERKVRMA